MNMDSLLYGMGGRKYGTSCQIGMQLFGKEKVKVEEKEVPSLKTWVSSTAQTSQTNSIPYG